MLLEFHEPPANTAPGSEYLLSSKDLSPIGLAARLRMGHLRQHDGESQLTTGKISWKG